jgi:hypothetical protein
VLAGFGHLLFDIVMTTEAEFLLGHGQQIRAFAFVRLMAGQAFPIAGGRMINNHAPPLVFVAVQTKFFRISGQQVLLTRCGNMRTMASQTIAVSGHLVTAATRLHKGVCTKGGKRMALKAELSGTLVEHACFITGMRRVTGPTLSVLHRRMSTFGTEAVLQVGMAIVATFAIKRWQGKRLFRIKGSMAITTGLFGNRLMDDRFE